MMASAFASEFSRESLHGLTCTQNPLFLQCVSPPTRPPISALRDNGSRIGGGRRPVAQRAFGLRPPQHEPTLPNVPGTQWAANGSSESMAASAHTGMATFGRGSPAFSPGMSQVAGVARPAVDGNEDGSGGAGSSGIMQPMPVSAVMAGRAPNRSSTVPTGADIMLDALAEEEVARQAQRFLRQQPGWPPSS